ncbi:MULTISPECIES: GntR family transcriptional regulator [unclassified Burkholderia]|uniref:GntR family transcriptional regulator n=1 Tax=unclassified Burkholderia TaxID=2613784 RepID=UPI002AB03F50|nr:MULTISPECIES: GntR family transcriptional regulator [unclassified Burkholderia]
MQRSPRPLRPVVRQSTESLTINNLREYVLSGAARPGERITEAALATELQVARGTVRTGLHRLATEGLVVQTPYSGWHVAELDDADIWELYTLRGCLEGLAARLAAERMTDEKRVRLRGLYERFTTACHSGDHSAASQLDFELHLAIVEAAEHSRLLEHYRLVAQQVRLFIQSSNSFYADRLEDLVPQHAPIIEAVLSGDSRSAAEAAQQHNETVGPQFLESMRQSKANSGA